MLLFIPDIGKTEGKKRIETKKDLREGFRLVSNSAVFRILVISIFFAETPTPRLLYEAPFFVTFVCLRDDYGDNAPAQTKTSGFKLSLDECRSTDHEETEQIHRRWPSQDGEQGI
jgi:hypothetical protein